MLTANEIKGILFALGRKLHGVTAAQQLASQLRRTNRLSVRVEAMLVMVGLRKRG